MQAETEFVDEEVVESGVERGGDEKDICAGAVDFWWWGEIC